MNEVFSFYNQLYSGTGEMYSSVHNPISDPEYIIDIYSIYGIPKKFLVIPTARIVDDVCQINMVIPYNLSHKSPEELLQGILQDREVKYTYNGAKLPQNFIAKLETISTQIFYEIGTLVKLKVVEWSPMLQIYTSLRISNIQKLCKIMSHDNIIHPLTCGINQNMCDIEIKLPSVYQKDPQLLNIIINSQSEVCNKNITEPQEEKKNINGLAIIGITLFVIIIIILWRRKIHILDREV